MKEEFYNFLKSSNNNFFVNRDDKLIAVINKFQYNNKLDILYILYNYGGNLFDLHSAFKYAGIYDKENDKLYDLDYTIRKDILNIDYSNKEYINATELYYNISKDVNHRVKELVTIDDVDHLFDIKDVEIGDEINEYDVVQYFIDGTTSESLEATFKDYSTRNSEDLFSYLTDKDEFVEEKAREYILANTTEILRQLALANKQRKVLEAIEQNKEHPFHKIKSIIDAVNKNNCVTVNLTINKNGIEQIFKYKADALRMRHHSSYLAPWNIEKLSDRDKFKENFGESADLHYQDIVKITYGKKVIYEDKDFKEKVLEEESVLPE